MSSLASQFESINFSVLSLLYGPTYPSCPGLEVADVVAGILSLSSLPIEPVWWFPAPPPGSLMSVAWYYSLTCQTHSSIQTQFFDKQLSTFEDLFLF